MPSYDQHMFKHNYLAIAEGEVTDHDPVLKFGWNPQITNGATASIWTVGGLYPWSAFDGGAVNLYLASTNAGDTQNVVVVGLDGDYNQIEETVTLTGTTAVATTSTFLRVFRMYIVGSTQNVGDITAKAGSAGGTTVCQIDADYGQTLVGVYTVPAGYTAFITSVALRSGKGDDMLLECYQRNFGSTFRIFHLAEVYENTYRYDFTVPLRISEKTDIDIRVEALTQNISASCNFDMVLVHNSAL